MIRFGIVGAGWRAEFFLRVAKALPDRFTVTGVATSNAQRAQRMRHQFNVDVFDTTDELLKRDSDFIVTSVPRKVNAEVIEQLVDAGMPVLSETPPAETIEQMVGLCEWVAAKNGRVQVAEQYIAQPQHAARLALIQAGKLGPIHQAQVSVAHGYHGISLIRRFLGITFEDATIRGTKFIGKVIQGPGRSGPPTTDQLVDESQSVCTLDFGDRYGLFDFNGQQYFSYIRGQRVLVRGQRGEILNDTATWLANPTHPIRAPFQRHAAGLNGNLEGMFLKGIQCGEQWLYENPLIPAPLTDDEIGVGTCLLKMADYVNGGPAFYRLAEACQDHYLGLMCEQAVRTGQLITTQPQTWSEQ